MVESLKVGDMAVSVEDGALSMAEFRTGAWWWWRHSQV